MFRKVTILMMFAGLSAAGCDQTVPAVPSGGSLRAAHAPAHALDTGITDPASCNCADQQVCVADEVTANHAYATGATFSCVAVADLSDKDCTGDEKKCGPNQVCITDFNCQESIDSSSTIPDPSFPDFGNTAVVDGCHSYCQDVQAPAAEGSPCAFRDPDSTSLKTVCAAGLFCVPSGVTPKGYLVDGATLTCQSSVAQSCDVPSDCDAVDNMTCIVDPGCNPDLALDCPKFCANIAGDDINQ